MNFSEICDFFTCSLSFGDQGFSEASGFEWRRGFEIEPFFSGEGVDDLFLSTFLALGKSLVFADCHAEISLGYF